MGNKGLQATHYLIEDDFISVDFLQDYQDYYASFFSTKDRPSTKTCTRFHFFSLAEIDLNTFSSLLSKQILSGNNTDFWEKHYLGFVMVKPIPDSLIGFTLLKTYQPSKERNFWGTKMYKIPLLGNTIEINALAFQQQDSILGACATMAIWSMFHKVCETPYINLKTSGQITKETGIIAPNGNRLIPNKGLDIPQIATSITKNGLQTEVRWNDNVNPNTHNIEDTIDFNGYIKKIVNAHYRVGIPIILGFAPYKNSMQQLHAVTICGHNTENALPKPKSKPQVGIDWEANAITKLYVHDDQWGPYARFYFEGNDEIDTPWSFHLKSKSKGITVALIIPVYPKIRISYDDIEPVVLALNEIIEIGLKKYRLKDDLVWDLYLQNNHDFQNEILNSAKLSKSNAYDLSIIQHTISNRYPQFVWRAVCRAGDNYLFEFVFDATGSIKSMLCLDAFSYYDELNQLLVNMFKEVLKTARDNRSKQVNILSNAYLNFFVQHFNNQP